jgi:hypothetical protein
MPMGEFAPWRSGQLNVGFKRVCEGEHTGDDDDLVFHSPV